MENEALKKQQENYDKGLKYYREYNHSECIKSFERIVDNFIGENWTILINSSIYLGDSYRWLGFYQKAENMFERALSFYENQDLSLPLLKVSIFNYMGILLWYQHLFKEALVIYNKQKEIIDTVDDNLKEKRLQLVKFYGNTGLLYHDLGDYSKAINCFKLSSSILENLSNVELNVGKNFINLGMSYYLRGDAEKSIDYYFKALKIFQNTKVKKMEAIAYNNLGASYLRQESYHNALNNSQKALNINNQDIENNFIDIHFNYYNLGLASVGLEDYKQAMIYYNKAIKICEKNLPYSFNLASLYQSKSQLLILENKYKEAFLGFEKALAIFEHLNIRKLALLSEIYCSIGDLFFRQNKIEKAINYYQQAIIASIEDFNSRNIEDMPQSLEIIHSNEDLVWALRSKISCLIKLYKCDAISLFSIQDQINTTSDIITKIRNSFLYQSSKLNLAKEAVKIYEFGIEACFLAKENTKLNRLDRSYQQTFEFSEKSKGVLLLNKLKDNEAKLKVQLPREYIEKEEKLLFELNCLKKQIEHESLKDKQANTQKLEEWRAEKFDLREEYDQLIEKFEKEYPEYFQLKYDTKTVAVETIQAYLKNSPKTALISYFTGIENTYIFIVKADSYEIKKMESIEVFEEIILDFEEAMLDISEKATFIENAHQLYQLLIQPIVAHLDKVEELVIIPDGLMTKIPFEALLSRKVDVNIPYNNFPYLINQFEISYHYSVTLWYRNIEKENKVQKQKSFVGYAPVYSHLKNVNQTPLETFGKRRSVKVRGKDCWELEHSKVEIENVVKMFKDEDLEAQEYLFEAASEENFRKKSSKHSIIHIAGHGFVNEEKPALSGILFSPNTESEVNKDGMFSIGDAYNLKINADLVVLSCCETGIGEFVKGEGMIAMNRGFLYAGAKNVVYTLFKVIDESSCELVTHFYQAILEGKTYAEALRLTKIKMIQNPKHSPVNWAGYVLIGS